MNKGSTDKFTPFVVFGASKSGTTWLQRIIDAHPEVRCHFQLPLFVISDYEVWHPIQKVRKPLLTKSDNVFNKKSSPFEGVFADEKEQENYLLRVKFFKKLYASQLEIVEQIKTDSKNGTQYVKELNQTISHVLTEKFLKDQTGDIKKFGTKAYTDFEKLFETYPDARVISISRDGRDVAVSKRFHQLRAGTYFRGDERSFLLRLLHSSLLGRRISRQLSRKYRLINARHFKSFQEGDRLFSDMVLKKTVNEWKNTVDYLSEWSKHKKPNFLPVSYEKLKTDPLPSIKSVFDFLEVDSSEELIRNIIEETSFKRLKKNNNNSFFRSGKIGDWTTYFKEKDKRIFKQIAGKTLIELGYEQDLNW